MSTQCEKKRTLEIDIQTADRITIDNLKDTYKYIISDLEKLQDEIDSTGELPVYKNNDLIYNVKMAKHIQAVLEHFGEKV